MSAYLHVLRQAWSSRQPREKNMLLAMVVVVALGGLWVLLDWQSNAQARLNKQIPHARAQLQLMQEQATELAKLKNQPQKKQPDSVELLSLLRSSAAARQLSLTIAAEDSKVSIKGEQIVIEDFLIWLTEIQTAYRLKTSFLKVEGREGVGELLVFVESLP